MSLRTMALLKPRSPADVKGPFRIASHVVLLLTLLSAHTGSAQEQYEGLAPILERGYIAHWLVCGPFEPDVPGGVLAAIRDDAPALSDTDFMATNIPIARLRPRHLMRIPREGGEDALWQEAGTTGPELDLAPFFPDDVSGVAYAAFYVDSPILTQILLDIESPLGVRAWANGFPVAEYEPGPLEAVGKDYLAIGLRAGNNLVVFEVPGADYNAMAQARGLSTPQLTAGAMANRPRLRKTSGFALSVALHHARPIGRRLLYVPKLENAGTVSGFAGDLKQDVLLTIHNPLEDISEPVEAIVTVPGMPLPDLVEIQALDGGETRQVPIALPIGAATAGSTIDVSVRLASGDDTSQFTAQVPVTAGGGGDGIVRLITGHTSAIDEMPPTDEVYLDSVKRQLLFSQQALGYGFDLGYARSWYKPYVAMPALRDSLENAAQRGAVTVQGNYAPIDERIVGGTALWRNLQLGLHMAGSQLNSTTPHYLAWERPGIALQTPQLLRMTPMEGIVTDLTAPGIAPMNRLYDLTGNTRYLRRKQQSVGPATLDDLREAVALQRRELADMSLPTDVLVVENVVAPPEPFYRGNVDSLARAFPRIRLDDGGAAAFFEEVGAASDQVKAAIPALAVNLNLGQPGALLSQPALQRVHTELARQLEDAESLATLASLQGAVYPHSAMEFAWRQLLYYSTPETLGVPADEEHVLDALAAYREVAEWTDDSLRRSSEYLAGLVDTAGTVPLNQGLFDALVVVNPTGSRGTVPVSVQLPVAPNAGLNLVNEAGTPVAHVAEAYQGEQRLDFLAEDLPPYGYATYFVQAAERASRALVTEDMQIENEHLALFVDPATGAIRSLLDKVSGDEIAAGPLNEIVLLTERESENRGAQELWTAPPSSRGPAPSSIKAEVTAFRQRIRVETPLGGGTLTQDYTLYAGIPWVECETTLDGVNLSGKAAAASFAFRPDGASFLVGERFGTVVGARGQDDFVLRTRGGENVGGTVPYPANEWVALSANDAIQVGSGGVVPWEPTIIVYGHEQLERPARELQQALIARGIPSILQSDAPEKPDFLWTDSTTEQDSNDYLRAGYRMRVVLGTPDQNRFCGPLLAQVPEGTLQDYVDRIPSGARLLLHDVQVPDGVAPVPTLLLGGLTPAQSADLADQLTRAVRTGQRYLLPPSAYVPARIQQEPARGNALLFPGTLSVSQQKDGRLLLGLQHRTPLERKGGDGAELLDVTRFRYGIFPFQGDWRSARVPEMAARFNVKPVVARTEMHPGELPATQAFLEVSPPGVRVGGLKPAGFPTTTNTRTAFHPRDGYTLLAWEPTGARWSGTLQSSTGMLEAQGTDVLERPQTPWSVAGGGVSLEANGFQVLPLWFLPNVTKPHDGLARLGREAEPHGVLETRYWDERRGAAPVRKMPIGLLLRGSLTGDTPAIEVVVSNHTTDRTVQGTVNLEATSGLTFGPQSVYYSLGAGEQQVETIQLARSPNMEDEMAVVAETVFERQTYRDVLMTNEAPYVMETSRNGAQIRVSIRNNSSVYAKGYLDAIASPEHWGEGRNFPEFTVAPRRATVSVAPFKSQNIVFSLSDPDAAFPVVMKLAANGLVAYQRVTGAASVDVEEGTAAGAVAPPPPRARN